MSDNVVLAEGWCWAAWRSCIRLTNEDIIDLHDGTPLDTPVLVL